MFWKEDIDNKKSNTTTKYISKALKDQNHDLDH